MISGSAIWAFSLPASALVLILFLALKFPKPFEDFLRRSVKLPGMTAVAPRLPAPADQNASDSSSALSLPVSSNSGGSVETIQGGSGAIPFIAPRGGLVEQAVGNIKRDLAARGYPQPTAERDEVLVRFLALSAVYRHFDSVYEIIWGSQIELLVRANVADASGLPMNLAADLFEKARTAYPQALSIDTLDRWLGFLKSAGMIVEDSGRVNLTLDGKEFLKYMIDHHRDPFKLL